MVFTQAAQGIHPQHLHLKETQGVVEPAAVPLTQVAVVAAALVALGQTEVVLVVTVVLVQSGRQDLVFIMQAAAGAKPDIQVQAAQVALVAEEILM